MVQKCVQCNWLQEQRLCYSHDSNIVHSIEQWIVPPSCNGSTDLALRFIQQCISRTSGSKCCVPSTLLDRGNQPCGTLIHAVDLHTKTLLQAPKVPCSPHDEVSLKAEPDKNRLLNPSKDHTASSTVSRLVQSWNSTRFGALYIFSWIRLKIPDCRISTCLRIFQTYAYNFSHIMAT